MYKIILDDEVLDCGNGLYYQRGECLETVNYENVQDLKLYIFNKYKSEHINVKYKKVESEKQERGY